MSYLSRRSLLYGLSGFAVTSTLNACSRSTGTVSSSGAIIAQADVEPIIDPKSLEKPNLTIGFVPVNDCAPFAIAYEKGLFRKYGLNVTLSREASWATSRDGIIFGRLDAAPVVSGAVTNARIGAEGARRAPLCAGMTIHRHGNALTMNREMWQAGLRPLHEYKGDLERFGRDFRRYFEGLPPERRVWAVVLSSSIYEYFVRYLAAAVGINPLTAFRIIIVPPPQMVVNMRIGSMQAYMVAEPWNTRAIAGNEGVGFTFAQGREIWRGHPDRVLAMQESFIDQNPKTYRSLIKAMIEACQYCSKPENREEVAKLITARSFTGSKPRTCAMPTVINPSDVRQLPACTTQFTGPGIIGNYNYGGFDGQNRVVQSAETTLFYDLPPDLATESGSHSTFLWQSQAIWLMTQAARWGQIPEFPKDAEAKARIAWRTDLYREIATEMGIQCPSSDYQVEAAERFIDRHPFDPSEPVRYLNSFEIRANAAQSIYMA